MIFLAVVIITIVLYEVSMKYRHMNNQEQLGDWKDWWR